MSEIVDPSKLKVAELRAELQARGLDTKGNKPVLVERLRAALEEESAANEDESAGGEEEEEEVPQEEIADDPSAGVMEVPEDKALEPPQKKSESPSKRAEPVPKEPEQKQSEEVESEPTPTVKSEPEDTAKLGYEEAPMEELGDKSETGNGMDLNIKDEAEIKEEAAEIKVEAPETEESDMAARRGEKRALSRSRSPEAAPEAKKQRPEVEEVRVEDEPDYDQTVVALDWYNSDLSLVISKEDFLSAQPLTMQGFGYVWHGVRATYGFTRGRVFFEVKVEDYLPVPQLEEEEQHPHVLRVGWSVDDAGLTLGEDPFSYGYGGTAKASTNLKFKDYGKKFGKGDILGCFLDLESEPVVMSFTVNGQNQGIAYEVSHSDLGDQALFPHILTKNTSFRANFGSEPAWMEPLTGYIFTGQIPLEDRVLGSQGPEKRDDAEDNPSSPVGAEDDEGPPPPSGRASSPSVELLLNDSAAAVFERRDRSPQENSSNSQGEGPAPALQKKQKRRKKNPSVILTDAQERVLAQWLEVEGEFIYNRGKTAYKDKAKIARAWEEQGAKLEPPVSGTDLRTWFSSLRSRYGRLTNTVSGQATGSKRHTDRERWILELFPFLKAHIVRQHKTATLGLPTDDDTPATRTTAATTTTTTTTTATTTGVGVSHGDPDTPSPASEDEEVVVVPAIKVPRKPRTRKHPPMKPGAAIDSVIDGAKHFLSEFKELSGDRDTEAARHFLESLLPMLLKVGPSLMPIFRMEITACLRKYEQATKQGAEMSSHDLKYHIINSEYCPAPSPPKAQPQQQQQQLLMLEPQRLQQLQQLQQQLQQPQQQQPQLVPQLPATFPSIRQQGQQAVTSVTPQQLQLLQQQYLLRSPSTSSIGVPANNTTDLNMSLLMDMQLPGQASTASTPAKAPPQQSTTTLHTPTSSADF